MRRLAVMLLLLAACGSGGPPFEEAADACTAESPNAEEFVTVDDAGIYINGAGNGSRGAGVPCIGRILAYLEVPESIIQRMDSTTALMGVQEATHEDLALSWTYHPDNGLDISISEAG